MSAIYATVAEFNDWPTGLRVTDLVPGGSAEQQTAQLQLILQQASSAIDRHVYQPLYAHSRTETQQVRADPYGALAVRTRDFPLLSVTSAQWQQRPSQGWFPIDLAQVIVVGTGMYPREFIASDQNYAIYSGWGLPPITVQATYVAGYPNMLLTSAATALSTSITVDTSVGVSVGDEIKIYDGVSYETNTVASVSGETLTLSQPLTYSHAVGVRVSEVPDAVSTACILWAAFLLKERRGGGAIRMSGTAQPLDLIDSEDMQLVRELLVPFRRVI